MALLYHRSKVDLASKDVIIRVVEDDDYKVAITFPEEEDENAITELLLTEAEVREAYDLLFNK